MERINNALVELQKTNNIFEISNGSVEGLMDELQNAKVCTPIIGKFSTGKSALVNTVLGYSKKILKEDITPETAVPVEITYNANEDVAGVYYNDGTYEAVEVSKYKNLQVDANTVRCAKLSLRNSFLGEISDVMLVDMPGFESGYEVHNRAIDSYLPKSLAYIITFAADDMIVRTSVGNILKELCLHDMPICIAITKFDKCNDEFEHSFENLKENLRKFVGNSELHYCVTSSFNGDVEELYDFLRTIQEESQNILFKQYRTKVLVLVDTTENYLKTTLKSSEMSESELDEQEEKLGKKLDALNGEFEKEKSNFDNIISDCVDEIKVDIESALRAEEDSFVAMLMNKQSIGDRINLIVRNAVTQSVKKRFIPKVEKYLKRVGDCVASASIDSVNVPFNINMEDVSKSMMSTAVSIAAAGALYLIAGPVGVVISLVTALVGKWNEDKKREELKNKIRTQLNSEVYPKVVDEVGNKIESALMAQLEVVNTSIEENIATQREILEKAIHDLRNKINDERTNKENLVVAIQANLEVMQNVRANLQNN